MSIVTDFFWFLITAALMVPIGLLVFGAVVTWIGWSRLPEDIPLEERKAAVKQWWRVGVPYGGGVLLTYFPMGMLVAATTRPTVNHLGEFYTEHDEKYISKGSSGHHVYLASPYGWLDWWNNYEDGTAGEGSGKHSARVGGNEYSWWNQYSWSCRNPFNKAKRTSDFFACFVNDCEIEYWGKESLSDKNEDPEQKGWYFVKATHKQTGKVYYGYRSVILLDAKAGEKARVRQVNLGFKLKPTHANTTQDPDDLDKAFTLRMQWSSEIN
ncbi:hypothetical protein HBA55_03480 [Pseudomaricurvus alkylphenolicus]|uniref:DUF7338 family protein n=1 Tax=Pseudomaricurvus alkylphenolicus TaxID=1306991 RepID=UPI0014216871|nr:hypothetical protein [Pseudomaricurvus alkylphenolicus]NIB38630.1 hypothetical protein [Pseudomaricurvus alkylphenolicus]